MPVLDRIPLVPGAAQWEVWTTTARLVVTDPSLSARARELVEAQLRAVDRACSRFRPDSELAGVYAGAGRPVPISPLLAELVEVGLAAARRTNGDVDPTVGARLADVGYDRSLPDIVATGATTVVYRPVDWREIRLDGLELTVPPGTRLDLGATAKAYTADRCANEVATRLGVGVLVSLGGDVATAGPAPAEGWHVLVQDQPGDPADTIRIQSGTGVATSSTVSRRWPRDGQWLHHIIDPRTGRPADAVWRTVTVAAASCVEANTASTAALVRASDGLAFLRGTGLPARLVSADRTVRYVNGWPADE
jgi:thiamine biosynthesis lipoprotein